jgi:hypothetical protein
MQNAVLGFGGLGWRSGSLCKRSGPSLFAGAHATFPELRKRHEPHLEAAEPEAIAGVLDVGSIEPPHERLDTSFRFPWRFRKPAGKEHVVLGFQLAELGFEELQIPFEV